MSQRAFYTRFTTEKDCKLYLKTKLEIGDMFCPKCGNKNIVWNEKLLHWRCKCMHRMSVKSMTFMKDSNIALLKWFETIYIFVNTKKPMSDLEFSRKIGIKRYKTVHYMLLKIRKQMSNELARLDFKDKIPLAINEQQSCEVLIKKSKKRKTDKIKLQLPFKNIEQYSFLLSSTYSMKKIVVRDFFDTAKIPFLKEKSKKWVGILKLNFNKVIGGIHHYTTNFHLQLYLDEYAFKYNNRFRENRFDYFMELDVNWQKSAQSLKTRQNVSFISPPI